MEWLKYAVGGIVIVAANLYMWYWTNKRRVKVSVGLSHALANVQIQACEECVVTVSVTNTGRKPVSIKKAVFVVDGQPIFVVIDRARFLTLQKGFPKKLEPEEQHEVNFPATAFAGKLTEVWVEDFLEKRWRAKGVTSLICDFDKWRSTQTEP